MNQGEQHTPFEVPFYLFSGDRRRRWDFKVPGGSDEEVLTDKGADAMYFAFKACSVVRIAWEGEVSAVETIGVAGVVVGIKRRIYGALEVGLRVGVRAGNLDFLEADNVRP